MNVRASFLLVLFLAVACSGPAGEDMTRLPTSTQEVVTFQSKPASTPKSVTTTPKLTLTPTPAPALAPTTGRAPIPDRDLFDLAGRLVLKSAELIPRVVNRYPVSYTEGRKDQFHVIDIVSRERGIVTATLQLVTDHAYWYVDDLVSFRIEALVESAEIYETVIYPSITSVFGAELVPGVDNDVHLTILHTPLGSVAGYYSSVDEFPARVHPFSNQREMIYISTDTLVLNTRSYLGTLAHELTHAVQFKADPTEHTWVNEGLAEIGKEIAGFTSQYTGSFLEAPSTSLTLWSQIPTNIPNYAAATLFMDYLAQHYGIGILRHIIEEPADSIQGIDAYLAANGEGKGFVEVFADWLVANYLDDPQGGIYSYPNRDIQGSALETLQTPGQVADWVPQYGAKYYDLSFEKPEVVVTFRGVRETPILIEGPLEGGTCWWSNRGDSIDTTLTRKFQLPNLEILTMDYSLWYDLEDGWDFAYVEVSVDDGLTWDILEGTHTLPEDPLGNAFGHGYTGSSAGWIIDQVDLAAYGGQEVLLRFEYVTDDSFHGPGLCVDEIAIPAIGYADNPETDDGVWNARGFIRIDNRVPQSYVLRVIEMGAETIVRDIRLDDNQEATFTIEAAGLADGRAIIIVSGTSDQTMLPASFQMEVSVPEA